MIGKNIESKRTRQGKSTDKECLNFNERRKLLNRIVAPVPYCQKRSNCDKGHDHTHLYSAPFPKFRHLSAYFPYPLNFSSIKKLKIKSHY